MTTENKDDKPQGQNLAASGSVSGAATCSVCHNDIIGLRELLPPKKGEYLRQWVLRCVCLGLLTIDESLWIKNHNPAAWHREYILPNDQAESA